MVVSFIFLTYLSLLFNSVQPFFNFEELKLNHYSFQLSPEPVLKSTDVDESIMYMTSKYGQQYECNVPEFDTDKNGNNEDSAVENRPIPELLEPMKLNSCLIKVRDWWTYEFCYGKEIKQYHYEDGKGILGPIISLGYFERDFDWNNITDDNPNKKMRYHSQYYSSGTKCDLTGKPRHTEVRFYCDEDNVQSFARIDEPSSCQYIVEIRTHSICKHVYTKPAFKIRPKQISCSPVLTADQFDLYTQTRQEKRRKAEEKRKLWLLKEKAKLNELKGQVDQTSVHNHASAGMEPTISKHESKATTDELNLNDVNNNDENPKEYVDYDIHLLEGYLSDQLEKLKRQGTAGDETNSNPVVDPQAGVDEIAAKGKSEDQVTAKPETEAGGDKEEISSLINIEQKLKHKLDTARQNEQAESTQEEVTKQNSDAGESSESIVDENVDDASDVNSATQLKESITEKLAQAGINAAGQNIQIKIIRVSDDNEVEEWSDQTTNDVADSVHKTIIAYVQGGGMRDSLKQMMKQQEMEKNYRFVWNRQSTSKTNEEKER